VTDPTKRATAIAGTVAAAALIAAVVARYGTQTPPVPNALPVTPAQHSEAAAPAPAPVAAVVTAAPAPTVLATAAPAPPCCMATSWRFTTGDSRVDPDFADETITFTLIGDGIARETETRVHVSGRVTDQTFDRVMPRSQFFGPIWRATLDRSGGATNYFGMLTVPHEFEGVDETGNPPPIPTTVAGRRRAVTP
jgi:hypothetical protein